MPVSYLDQYSLPRGLRNNNPGNLRDSGDDWKGMIGVDEDGFIRFSDLSWGIRAMATDVANKISKSGLDTITKIINRYAPASDGNNVPAYIGRLFRPGQIAAVSRKSGFGANEHLTMSVDTLHRVLRGMIDHEVGEGFAYLVTNADIDEGINLMNSGLLSLFKQVRDNPGLSLFGGVAIVVLLYLVGRYAVSRRL